jgi:UDP-N-acetylmuramyl tripeptide synthase
MHTWHSAQDAAGWLRSRVTGQLRTDSRQVQAGDGFIAWPGAATDGRRYLAQALAQGATACLMEQANLAPWLAALQEPDHEALACMSDLKAQTAMVADAYYEHPSQALQVLAVTGTNGKTSTACLLLYCSNLAVWWAPWGWAVCPIWCVPA